MKKASLILIGILALNIYVLKGQDIIDSTSFCNNKSKGLSCCSMGEYILEFTQQSLKSFYTKDTSIYLDIDNKSMKLRTSSNDMLVIKIKSDFIEIYCQVKDTIIHLPINDKTDICKGGNTMQLMSLDKQAVQVLYNECRISGLLFPSINGRSIIIWIVSTSVSGGLAWDVIVNSFSGKAIKIFSNKMNGKPESIFLCNKIEVNADYKRRDPGIEFVSVPNKLANSFYKIRSVATTEYHGVFDYRDLIVYDKKGKVKSAKIPVEQCTCK